MDALHRARSSSSASDVGMAALGQATAPAAASPPGSPAQGNDKSLRRMSEEERQARRRCSNRESARRMRAKQNQSLIQLQHQVHELTERNRELEEAYQRLLCLITLLSASLPPPSAT